MDRAHRLGKSVARPFARLAIAASLVAAALPVVHAQPVGADKQGRVRVIGPSIITAPPVDADDLQRIAPRPPLGASRIAPATSPEEPAPTAESTGEQTAPPAEEDGMTTLFRPVASAAGRIKADDRSVAIAGIDIVDPDRSCDASDGGTWPCGMRARTAFRYWLRGRAVDCDLDNARKSGDRLIAQCALAGQDVGAWLVDQGWALADRQGPYVEAGKAAREAGRGVFGGGRAAD